MVLKSALCCSGSLYRAFGRWAARRCGGSKYRPSEFLEPRSFKGGAFAEADPATMPNSCAGAHRGGSDELEGRSVGDRCGSGELLSGPSCRRAQARPRLSASGLLPEEARAAAHVTGRASVKLAKRRRIAIRSMHSVTERGFKTWQPCRSGGICSWQK